MILSLIIIDLFVVQTVFTQSNNIVHWQKDISADRNFPAPFIFFVDNSQFPEILLKEI